VKIGIVTNLFPPIQTGSSFWARELAASLAAEGDEVVVITCGFESKATIEEYGKVIVYRLPVIMPLPQINLFLNFEQFYLLSSAANRDRMKSIFREHRIEVVHQCGQLLDSILMTRKVCRQMRLPSVCSIHTKIFHPGNQLYDLCFRIVDRVILRNLVINQFDLLMPLDDVLAKYATSIYGCERLAIVPVCIDSQTLQELPAEPSVSGNPLHIVSIGHVTEMRSRKELLVALAALKCSGYDFRLTIVGKVLTNKTQNLIDVLGLTDNVALKGEVPRAQLFNLLRSAHIEAHWLDIPGIGSAAMEAMAIGLPVVTYGYEGLYGDVPLRHGENIMFIDPKSPDTILKALQTLVESPELRKQIGRNARRLVQEHLTWSVVIKKVRSLYQEVIG
jgi:glycosyltransferase involved in cell wall biosynthesis